MKNEKLDRRMQRTRQLLKGALLELIIEKDYNAITVQNIIDQANLGRSTFYAHYLDKDDLLLSGMEEIVHSLILNFEAPASPNEKPQILFIEPIFRHAQEQFELHKALVGGRGIEMVLKTIQNHLIGHIQEQVMKLVPEGKTLSMPPALIANHLAGTLLNLLVWWLDNNMPYSPTQMDGMFQNLTMPGVLTVLGINL